MPFYANDPISFYNCLVGEGRGKGHSQNWPNNIRHHPISFSSNILAQSSSLLTESLKTRLIYILSPCCHFWNMNYCSCSHKGHLWKSLLCRIYEALKARQMFLRKSTPQKQQPPLSCSLLSSFIAQGDRYLMDYILI